MQRVAIVPDTEDYQHSSSRHSHSDHDELPKYGISLKASTEDVDTPSTKVSVIRHPEKHEWLAV